LDQLDKNFIHFHLVLGIIYLISDLDNIVRVLARIQRLILSHVEWTDTALIMGVARVEISRLRELLMADAEGVTEEFHLDHGGASPET
jgi:hypothetical protein